MDENTTFSTLEAHVVKTALCTHCGTCEGVCPVKAITMDDVLGDCLPQLTGECISCGTCYRSCPGISVNFAALSDSNKGDRQEWLGAHEGIFIAHAQNARVHQSAASGGMGTALAQQFLEENNVDAVINIDFDRTMPWIPLTRISSHPDHLVRSAQSKYFIYPQNRILQTLKNHPVDSVAIFALPCQVHGLRKAQQQNIPGSEKIKYIIGLFCGNNLYYEATRSLFRRFRITDFNYIRSMAYRAGDYPGNFELHYNESRYTMDKFTFNYLSCFYTPFRCLFCVDLCNECADISIGDAWCGINNETNMKGASLVIVRNPILQDFFYNGIKADRYVAKPVYAKDAIRMHANVLTYKKIGAYARMKWWRRFKRTHPVYDRPAPNISIKRFLAEGVVLLVYAILQSKFMRNVSHRIPLFIVSPFLKFIRRVWRRKSAMALNLINDTDKL